MTTITDFYQLKAWQENHQLVLSIYKITKDFPKEEKYGIIDQLRRASSSVTANIAEGFGRFHFADKIRFYLQARGSLKETENFIYLSQDLKYLDKETAKKLWQQAKIGEQLLNGLIKSANKQKA
ncbi:four helix bundle protein [Patescibacteria group bacterium]|nr:four helix bundle protein [Patescibacteria group bacterium]